jgi:WD40 repeat protein
VGLIPYSVEDAPFFFGRDADREIITANLMASHLTLVYGSSGVGKSSVLHAGVAYYLRQQARDNLRLWKSPEFSIALFSSWRDDPIAGLLSEVRSGFESIGLDPSGAPFSNSERLAEKLYTLARWSNGDLFIVLDQFEEYFLYHGQEDGEGTFAVEFPRAVSFLPPQDSTSKPEDRLFDVNFLIAIREDALAKLDRFKGHIPNLYDNYLRVSHLDSKAAREAIVRPVEEEYNRRLSDGQSKFSIEPELVDEVLDKAKTGRVGLGEPDAVGRGVGGVRPDELGIETPFLQLVMTRLWEEETQHGSRNLSLATLTRLGGAESIASKHFHDEMGKLTDDERDLASHILRRLITPSGTKYAYSAADLAKDASVPEPAVESLLVKMSQETRILRKVEPAPGQKANRFEIFHDVLATGILAWVAQYRQVKEQAEVAQRAADEAEQERRRREAADAKREAEHERRLREAAEAAQKAERERAEEAEARKKDAWGAAKRHKQLGSRFLVAAIVAGVLAAVTGGLALVANNARNDANDAAELADARLKEAIEAAERAKESARLAEAGRIAGLSEAERDKRLDRALLLTMEALRTASTPGTRSSLLRALLARPGLVSFLHHDDTGKCMAFSPDGKIVAAGVVGRGKRGLSRSRLVLWDAAQHKHQEDVALPGGVGSVISMAFSPDGKTIAVGTLHGNNGAIVLWSTEERKWGPTKPLAVPGGAVLGLAFSHDGKTLAAGCHDLSKKSGLVLWESDKGTWQQVKLPPVTEDAVRSVAFHPEEKILAVGYAKPRASSGGVRLVSWDDAQSTWMPREPDLPPVGPVTSVAFSADGKFLAAGIEKVGVVRWDMAKLTSLQPQLLPVPEGDVRSIAFNRDGKLAAGLTEAQVRGGVVLWFSASGARLQPGHLPVPEGAVNTIAFSSEGKTFATGLSIPHSDSFASIKDVAEGWGAVLLWDTSLSISIRPGPQIVSAHAVDRVDQVASSPDGKTKARVTEIGGNVLLWDASKQTEQQSEPLPISEGAASSVAFSQDGEILAAGFDLGEKGGRVVLWDVAKRVQTGSGLLEVPEGGVTSVAFSPDNQTLAVGVRAGRDGGVVLWKVVGWERLETKMLPIFEGDVESVAFSPDGKLLAAGINVREGGNGAVIWETSKRRRWITDPLTMPVGNARRVSFSSDSKKVAVEYGVYAGRRHEVREVRWDLDLDSWQLLAKQIANRNLTRAEWREYFPETPYHATFEDLPVPAPETNRSTVP